MSDQKFDPTFEGLGVLALSAIVLWYATTSFQFASTSFNFAVTVGLLGVVGSLLDILGYIDMDDYVDFEDLGEESSQKTRKASKSNPEKPEKTPPAPQKMKNELYYDRADGHCEHCNERVDQPHVHHITPRAEGGPNKESNLIVLCPNCHTKADAGLLAKHRLRFKAREQNKNLQEQADS